MKRSIQRVAHVLIFLAPQLLALQIAAATTTPDKVPKPEKGKGWYVMVLWESGTPIPGGDGTKLIKKVKEPDLGKLLGKLLNSKDNMRFIELPVAAARELRQHESVAILQRLWAGEPLEELKEEPYPARSSSGLETESDTNLDWGPKDYTYDGSGNIKTIGPAGAPDSYAYDTAGRLIQATVGGKTETFKYDAFGNLIEKTVAGANPEVVPVDGSSNRMIGASYDAAGNVTTRKGVEAYQYDSFNMLTVMPQGGRYNLYDANDERVGLIDDNLSRWWLRDLDGQLIREYASQTSTNPNFDPVWVWQQDYVYAGGQLVGGEKVQWSYSEPGGGTVYGGRRHYHLDHLGSVRVVTDDAGRSVSEHDYYAFGVTPTKAFQEELETTWVAIDSMRYAGHQRDFLGWHNIENRDYLDYMHARYYDPNLGRFLSVDPGKDWDLRKPQSWNMYSYVRNNPINRIDPTGRCGEDASFIGPRIPCAQSEAKPKQQRNNSPAQGQEPGTREIPDGRGGKTVRTYGPDGRAVNDVDHGHGHDGAPDPHVHDWDWDKKRPRQPGRAPNPGEIPDPAKSTLVDQRRPDLQTIIGATILSIGGTAMMIMTGGAMTLQPNAAGVVIVPGSGITPVPTNQSDCPPTSPYCT